MQSHAVQLLRNGVPAVVQVVHHPTIIAMHGEGESWSFEADADVRAKFWGRSVELLPVGLIRLKFDDGDEYQWAKVGNRNAIRRCEQATICVVSQDL